MARGLLIFAVKLVKQQKDRTYPQKTLQRCHQWEGPRRAPVRANSWNSY